MRLLFILSQKPLHAMWVYSMYDVLVIHDTRATYVIHIIKSLHVLFHLSVWADVNHALLKMFGRLRLTHILRS